MRPRWFRSRVASVVSSGLGGSFPLSGLRRSSRTNNMALQGSEPSLSRYTAVLPVPHTHYFSLQEPWPIGSGCCRSTKAGSRLANSQAGPLELGSWEQSIGGGLFRSTLLSPSIDNPLNQAQDQNKDGATQHPLVTGEAGSRAERQAHPKAWLTKYVTWNLPVHCRKSCVSRVRVWMLAPSQP
jgi:hypothetical protein